MTQVLKDLGDYIAAALPNDVLSTEVNRVGELTVLVRTPSIAKVLTFLRDDSGCLFKQLVDVCGVDWPGREDRFDVVYHLLSLKHNQRVRVKVATDEETPVPSVVGVFSSAGWFERETWDMFGVIFSDHPDLRRLLTDYGFEGHPLRKDFPLTGHVELRYDDELKRCVYEPVKLVQDFRNFDFLSPWEGQGLPGDEKAGSH
ncbi:NADH-quinone oxidoreductase subunit C [Magnetospirillum gryphiswaldense]|jgi:NADH-quinone oxidoreductase subunit C|uniref:NADH-quinone oxidoreductase subunit C n=2 Tax=Magnetospirillum gryphiswaldense TaxID=55518 RepID=V6EZ53_MAGGM|nr:NADH-quinone oxidoreductase subunit C [Magnetospirillum gryphiswaldense]AVM73441.1 NADH-quinone oxidoreductase subunit C 1 [Magnetospirillum gryphiswaldense MSR-1]AVM77344.1 NADH-quinone oxidoreductase subunit C 1 [Magnetospirillum gryphiswaldense]CAM76331.1 NADH dehydrogenase I, C subunit [Magnetospirillum gryphiswaldense MSR-1]CDK98540.1 NADH-quinone oxidoreductase subunit C [Magnetospirillum gryphiswaldense MSR-1 v2]